MSDQSKRNWYNWPAKIEAAHVEALKMNEIRDRLYKIYSVGSIMTGSGRQQHVKIILQLLKELGVL